MLIWSDALTEETAYFYRVSELYHFPTKPVPTYPKHTTLSPTHKPKGRRVVLRNDPSSWWFSFLSLSPQFLVIPSNVPAPLLSSTAVFRLPVNPFTEITTSMGRVLKMGARTQTKVYVRVPRGMACALTPRIWSRQCTQPHTTILPNVALLSAPRSALLFIISPCEIFYSDPWTQLDSVMIQICM